MAGDPTDRASALFTAASALPSGERSRFLREAAPDDPALAEDVRSLLEADDRAKGFLEPASPGEAGPGRLAPGDRVGRYTIVRRIGEGGMGVVYEAIQDHPRRPVALKVLRTGLDAPASIRRFEFEAEVLGRLRHPAIAQVHEAGVLGEGPGAGVTPFFAMEFVAGARPVTEHAAGLGLRARVELFEEVCGAVAHGHRAGVIHRDLKPGNILVDAEGRPKIIDFGVARAADTDRAGPRDTGVGQLVGTLRYMSPEQCAGDPAGIDTRSDVYALGLVLYEVLTGHPPYDLPESSVFETMRVIRESPPRPPGRTDRRLRGDLTAIVLKALEKDPADRYQSAQELARDLRHWRAGEPIEARRQQAGYVLRRTLRRHWVPASAAAALLVVVAASSVALGVMYARQGRLLGLATRREADARRTLEWLRSVLGALTPERTRWRDAGALRAMLDDAASRVSAELGAQPADEASMRGTLGRLYGAIGAFPEAETQLRRAVDLRRGPDSPELAGDLAALGAVLMERSAYTAAAGVHEEALAMRTRVFGDRHPAVAESLRSMSSVAHSRADYAESQRLLERSLGICEAVLGPDHPDTAASVRGIGIIRHTVGDLAGAETLLRRSDAAFRRALGDRDPEVASTLTSLAKVLHARGALEDADRSFREALSIFEDVYGPEHPNVAWCLHRRGNVLHDLGRDDEAEPMLERALRLYERFQGENDPYTAFTLDSLGTLRMDQGRFADARACFERSLAIQDHLARTGQPLTLWRLNRLACLAAREGDAPAAESLLRRALSERPTQEAGAYLEQTLVALGDLLVAGGRPLDGVPWLEEAYQACSRNRGPDDPGARALAERIADVYTTLGRPEDAGRFRTR